MLRNIFFLILILAGARAGAAPFAPISVGSGSANGHTCLVVSWTDSAGRTRQAWIAADNHKITRLVYDLGAGPVTDNEVSGYGLGNLTNHGSCGATVTRLGVGVSGYVGYSALDGPNHYIWRSTFRFDMCGSGQKWRITNEYMFVNGRDDFLQTVAYDSSDVPAASSMGEDMRGPYDQMTWGGNPNIPVSGVGWGDHYKFKTTGAFTPDTPGCLWDCTGTMPWDWSQPNSIPYTWAWKDPAKGADIDREYGVIQTQRDSEQDFGGAYFGSGNVPASLPAVSSAPHRMFECWAAPTQMDCYDSPWTSGRMTWGATYGTFNNGHVNDRGQAMNGLSFRPINSWSWLHQVGLYSSGRVQALVTDTENIYKSDLSVQSPGSVALTGPRAAGDFVGPSVGTMPVISYPKAGYDFVYRAWAIESAGQNVQAGLQIPSGASLDHPLFEIRSAPGTPCRVRLDGVDLAADQAYSASYDAAGQKLWLSLNSALGAGDRALQVDFNCGSPTPTPTFCAACTATFTPTLTATPSPTPLVCALTLYNGEAGANGGSAWAAPAPSSIAPSAAAAHSGSAGLAVALQWTGWWGGMGYNWANYAVGSAALDLSGASSLEIWFKAPGVPVNGLFVSLADESGTGSAPVAVDPNLQGGPGVDGGWKKAVLPIAGFTGIDLTKVWEFDVGISTADSGSATFYIDDVSVLMPCGGGSPTPTVTAQAVTPTATPSRTPTRTATRTATPSASPSPAGSPTDSPSPTPSASVSPYQSPSSSPTLTPSPTLSPSWTASPTLSATPTASPIQSATATATGTPSPSATSSRTASPVQSPTPTATRTPSATASATPSPVQSPSASPTRTRSASPSASPSPTPSATPTATASPSPDSAVTATATAPSTAEPGAPLGPVIVRLAPYPNPDPLSLRVDIEGRAESLELQVYTKAMVLSLDLRYPGGSGWVELPLPEAWRALPAGLYFARVRARSAEREAHAATRLLRLRP